jgi:hypothetical protein
MGTLASLSADQVRGVRGMFVAPETFFPQLNLFGVIRQHGHVSVASLSADQVRGAWYCDGACSFISHFPLIPHTHSSLPSFRFLFTLPYLTRRVRFQRRLADAAKGRWRVYWKLKLCHSLLTCRCYHSLTFLLYSFFT